MPNRPKSIEQRIFMPELNRVSPLHKHQERAVLSLETYKSGAGGVQAHAQLFWTDDETTDPTRMMVLSCVIFQDFSARVFLDTKLRATQANMLRVHRQCFTPGAIETLKADAIRHQAKVDAEAKQGERIA